MDKGYKIHHLHDMISVSHLHADYVHRTAYEFNNDTVLSILMIQGITSRYSVLHKLTF
jgi:hypothetical protein